MMRENNMSTKSITPLDNSEQTMLTSHSNGDILVDYDEIWGIGDMSSIQKVNETDRKPYIVSTSMGYEVDSGGNKHRKRVSKRFATLEEAEAYKRQMDLGEPTVMLQNQITVLLEKIQRLESVTSGVEKPKPLTEYKATDGKVYTADTSIFEFAEYWVDVAKCKNKGMVSDYKHYQSYLRRPKILQGKKLSDVTDDLLRKAMNEFIDTGLQDGGKPSWSAICRFYSMLFRPIEYAMECEIIPTNKRYIIPRKEFECKKPNLDDDKLDVYTDKQVEQAYEVIGDDVLMRAVIAVFNSTGARHNELRSLRWADFDEEKGELWIKSAVKHGTMDIGTTKTDRPRSAPIVLDKMAVDCLLKLRELQETSDLYAKARSNKKFGVYIFINLAGNLFDRKALSERWARYKEILISEYGWDKSKAYRLYDFRHTAITRWIEEYGFTAAEVAGLAGTSIQMIEKVYFHQDEVKLTEKQKMVKR